MAAARNFLMLAAVLAGLCYSGAREQVLGPRDPIAADGSLTAGRALTIGDQQAALEKPRSDLDDPVIFRERLSASSVESDRLAVLGFVGLAGPTICEWRAQMIAAIRKYYGTKAYFLNEFHFRGPRAARFVDDALASPEDRKIDALVQQWIKTGYLRANEIRPRDSSFVLDVLAQEFRSNACSRT